RYFDPPVCGIYIGGAGGKPAGIGKAELFASQAPRRSLTLPKRPAKISLAGRCSAEPHARNSGSAIFGAISFCWRPRLPPYNSRLAERDPEDAASILSSLKASGNTAYRLLWRTSRDL